MDAGFARTALPLDSGAPDLCRLTDVALPLVRPSCGWRPVHVSLYARLGCPDESTLHKADIIKGDLSSGSRMLVPCAGEVGEGGAEHACRDGDTFRDVLQSALPLLGRLGCDHTEGVEGGFGCG